MQEIVSLFRGGVNTFKSESSPMTGLRSAFKYTTPGLENTLWRNIMHASVEQSARSANLGDSIAYSLGCLTGTPANTASVINKTLPADKARTISSIVKDMALDPKSFKGRYVGIGLGVLNVALGGTVWGKPYLV